MDLETGLMMLLMGWAFVVIVSTDAQATVKQMCASENEEHMDCLMAYIANSVESLAFQNTQNDLDATIESLKIELSDLIDERIAEQLTSTGETRPANCHDIWTQGNFESKVYSIFVPNCMESSSGRVCSSGETHVRVFCDMEFDFGGPGWTVFQRRQDGSVNFTRDWNAYKQGFGDPNGELWLGNDNIAKITASGNFQLRIDLGDWEGEYRYAEYSFIRVLGADDKYQLFFGDYSGDAGDAFGYSSTHSLNGTYFSTIDQDNDQSGTHCALQYSNAGFWYNNCGYALLNNPYHFNSDEDAWKGIMWSTWHGLRYSMKSTVMKIRPIPMTN